MTFFRFSIDCRPPAKSKQLHQHYLFLGIVLNGVSRIYIYPFVVKMEQGNDIGMKNIARNVVAMQGKGCHIENADNACFIL